MTLTLQKIARLAGVSRSTASRVINEHPNVRPAVRERVWQVIREHGYQPNPIARLLAASRTGEVGADQPAKEVAHRTDTPEQRAPEKAPIVVPTVPIKTI